MRFGKFLKDYENVTSTDEKGREVTKTVYVGKFYDMALNARELDTFKKTNLLLVFFIGALHLGAGFAGNKGTYQMYISVPYTAAFFPLLYLALSVFMLPELKRPYRRDEVELSFGRMLSSGKILLGFLAVIVLAAFIFQFSLPDAALRSREFLFITLEAGALGLCALLVYKRKKVGDWVETPGQEHEQERPMTEAEAKPE
ncbi:MAG: hypothetical protein ACOYKD_01985 [Anaerolineaceae bacterium]|jgi:hypothetical protein